MPREATTIRAKASCCWGNFYPGADREFVYGWEAKIYGNLYFLCADKHPSHHVYCSVYRSKEVILRRSCQMGKEKAHQSPQVPFGKSDVVACYVEYGNSNNAIDPAR